MLRAAQEPRDLSVGQGLRRPRMGAGGFHFHENHFAVFFHDKVNFARWPAPAPAHQPVPVIKIGAQRDLFGGFAFLIRDLTFQSPFFSCNPIW